MRAYYKFEDDLVEFETNWHTGRSKAFILIAEEAAVEIFDDGDCETHELFPMIIEIFDHEKKSLGKYEVELDYAPVFTASLVT